MPSSDRRTEVTTGDLIREAIEDSRALLNIEIALAKDECRREIAAMKVAAITFMVSTVLATLALASFLFGLLLVLPQRLHPAPVAGGILLIAAAIFGGIGYRVVPKDPMAETRQHIESDFQVLKGRFG